MKTYHFSTGVKPFSFNPPAGMRAMKGFKDSGNGAYVIPFDCESVPEGYTFEFACDHPDLYPDRGYYVAEIHNSSLLSKYAYFKPSLTHKN